MCNDTGKMNKWALCERETECVCDVSLLSNALQDKNGLTSFPIGKPLPTAVTRATCKIRNTKLKWGRGRGEGGRREGRGRKEEEGRGRKEEEGRGRKEEEGRGGRGEGGRREGRGRSKRRKRKK